MDDPDSRTRLFESASVGLRILVREWDAVPAASEGAGTVLLLHGLGDHSGRHRRTALLLRQTGHRVVSIDWPGCGASEGRRGDLASVPRMGELLDEVLEALDLRPVGIFAHSAGGFLLLHWLGRRSDKCRRLYGLRWLWLSAPLLRPSHRQPPWKIRVARALVRYFPCLSLGTGVRAEDCHHSDQPRRAEAERSRDGVHHRVSLRFASSLMEHEKALPSLVSAIRPGLALLLVQGVEDEVCPPRFAEELYFRFPSAAKTLLLVSGARHEPLREPDAPGLRPALEAWLDGRGTGSREMASLSGTD